MMHPERQPCAVSNIELLAYRDNALPNARRSQLTQHVDTCSKCRRRLADAAAVTDALQLGTPLRDEPLARAALHQRIAEEHAAWWRHPALIATTLPVALVLIILVGVARWTGDRICLGCSPAEPSMQITASAGLPADWYAAQACPALQSNSSLPRVDNIRGAIQPAVSAPGGTQPRERVPTAKPGNPAHPANAPFAAERQPCTQQPRPAPSSSSLRLGAPPAASNRLVSN